MFEIFLIRYLIGHDILLLYNSKAIINGLKAAKDLPVKIILYRGYTGNINWWDPTAYAKFLNPRVDKIICNAKAIQELLEKQLFFPKGKAVTINKGHDLSWYEGVETMDIHKEFDIPKDAFVITCVANARRMKGMKYLTKAMDYIPIDKPIHLLLVGSGLDSPDIMKRDIIKIFTRSRYLIKCFLHVKVVCLCFRFLFLSLQSRILSDSYLLSYD